MGFAVQMLLAGVKRAEGGSRDAAAVMTVAEAQMFVDRDEAAHGEAPKK